MAASCFGSKLELAALFLPLDVFHQLQATANGDEVGQRAAEPAPVDVELARAGRFAGDDFLRLLLGADEQDLAAAGGGLLDELERGAEIAKRLIQIDDVDAVARRMMYGFIFGFQRFAWCPK